MLSPSTKSDLAFVCPNYAVDFLTKEKPLGRGIDFRSSLIKGLQGQDIQILHWFLEKLLQLDYFSSSLVENPSAIEKRFLIEKIDRIMSTT